MNTAKEYTFSYEIKKPVLLIRALDMFRIISIAYLYLEINSLDRQIYKCSFQWHCGECLIKRGQAPPNNSLKLGKKTNSKPRAEKESIRLTARTGEFTRIVERATESSAA